MRAYYSQTQTDEEVYLSLANRPKLARKTFSKYRGVTSGSANYPYRAALTYAGRRYQLGAFKTELEAARAYNEASLRIIGPHAILNELPPG